jgi:hypothetical protein
VNAYSSRANNPSEERGWAVTMFSEMGMGVEPR